MYCIPSFAETRLPNFSFANRSLGPRKDPKSIEAGLEEVADVPSGRPHPLAAEGGVAQQPSRRPSQPLRRGRPPVHRRRHFESEPSFFRWQG